MYPIPYLRFFDDLEKKRTKAMDARNASEEKALEGFRSARKKSNLLGLWVLPYVSLLSARKHGCVRFNRQHLKNIPGNHFLVCSYLRYQINLHISPLRFKFSPRGRRL